jgi:hypothetical protein
VPNFCCKAESIFGHSAFDAGVTVTIVRASNVGVKVGMVGRGVMDAVGVSVGEDVIVIVGVCNTVGVFTALTSVLVAAGVHPVVICPHAARRNMTTTET